MKGLILKDFINLKRNIRIMTIFVLIYGIMAYTQEDASFLSSILVMLFAILFLNTYSLDEMAKWDGYALTMPITKEDIIKGKYISMLLLGIFGSGFSAVITILINVLLKKEDIFYGLQICGIGFAAVILFYSITIPFITKLGIEKARIIFIAVYMIPFLLGILIQKEIKKGSFQIPEAFVRIGEYVLKNVYLIVPLALLIILGISYMISVSIYRKKEF